MAGKFVDDDLGYEQWLSAHPAGFVLNCARQPNAAYLMLHRASCDTISGAPARGDRWTSGDYMKVCATTVAELEAWAHIETGGGVRRCEHCAP